VVAIENESIDVTNLLEKLPLEKVTVYFNLGFISIDFVKKCILQEKQHHYFL
jgi:methylmalonyl-CoA mutase